MPFSQAVYYFYFAIGLGLILGVVVIRYFDKKNKQKEYMKFN